MNHSAHIPLVLLLCVTSPKSVGLGLAIAREIAAAHGAAIVLTETAGGGTRAVVTLGGTEGADGETTARSVQRSGQNE